MSHNQDHMINGKQAKMSGIVPLNSKMSIGPRLEINIGNDYEYSEQSFSSIDFREVEND